LCPWPQGVNSMIKFYIATDDHALDAHGPEKDFRTPGAVARVQAPAWTRRLGGCQATRQLPSNCPVFRIFSRGCCFVKMWPAGHMERLPSNFPEFRIVSRGCCFEKMRPPGYIKMLVPTLCVGTSFRRFASVRQGKPAAKPDGVTAKQLPGISYRFKGLLF